MALTKLNIELQAGESLSVSGPATIKMLEKAGSRARLQISADESVKIVRPQKLSGAESARLGVRKSTGA